MTDHPRLIGLYSPAPRSGKTSVAQYLNCRGYRILSFATPIKAMVRTFLQHYSLDSAQIERYLVEDKELPIPNVGVSARHLCQTLGTEFGRACVHPETWIKAWQRTAVRDMDRGIDVVVDDVRFWDEALRIKDLGGELWMIQRPGVEKINTHASEGGLNDYKFDVVIDNDLTLKDLYSRVEILLAGK